MEGRVRVCGVLLKACKNERALQCTSWGLCSTAVRYAARGGMLCVFVRVCVCVCECVCVCVSVSVCV